MTLRDWLQLLIIPLLLGFLAVLLTAWFNDQQSTRQQQSENQRAAAERELADQRAQDEALQAYLDQMGNLILEKDLLGSEERSAVRTLAEARTLTVLERLDPSRRLTVIGFLGNSRLILNEQPIVSLYAANLEGIDFNPRATHVTAISKINFDNAFLTESQMEQIELNHASLRQTEMVGVQLQGADLEYADLTEAVLGSTKGMYMFGEQADDTAAADLSGADLSHATLEHAFLRRVDMSRLRLNPAPPSLGMYPEAERTIIRNDDYPGMLLDAGRTNLSNANLRYAFMHEADLRGAILNGADFTCADLYGADLTGAIGITKQELADQAEYLSGATMPDGSTIPRHPALRPCPGPTSSSLE